MSDVVAVNGLGGLEFLWDAFRAALPRRLRVLDLPGHGNQAPAADYRYAALVQDVIGRTADLEPFPLIGWSVGAAVGWLVAARHTDRISRLVLMDPAAPHQSPFRHGPQVEPVHAFTFASIENAVEALRGIDPTTTAADILASYRENAAGRWEPRYDPAILPALVEDARAHGEELYFELEQVRAPTLILRGERSFLRPEQLSEIAAALSDVRVETVPNAGHFMVREQPMLVARLVLEFLDS